MFTDNTIIQIFSIKEYEELKEYLKEYNHHAQIILNPGLYRLLIEIKHTKILNFNPGEGITYDGFAENLWATKLTN